MFIKTVVETSYPGMFKVETDETKFFIRQEYLTSLAVENLEPGTELAQNEQEELLDAGLACVVELKAVDYLARAEQSRFGLTRKLSEKKYNKKYIEMALTLLEQKNYLSDERFARAWLNSRKINHYEGPSKLNAELMARGISKDVANQAVENFFAENDEAEIFLKARERFIKRGKQDEKLTAALLQAGFSYKMIKNGGRDEE